MIQLAALVLVGGLVVCLSVVAARGPGGHRAVLRLLAGYGLLVLVLAGLLVVGLGVPRWQEAMASRQPPGPTAYAVLAGAVGLYLALLTQLARVALARPAPGPGTPATAAATG
ncbi:MAG: hypothetical protein K2X87_21550, partial [Gemmataceae bacterium]|nr:hypothetical protein [Gemmataceae bacterium]